MELDEFDIYYMRKLITAINPWIITPDRVKPRCRFCNNPEWVGHDLCCPYMRTKEALEKLPQNS